MQRIIFSILSLVLISFSCYPQGNTADQILNKSVAAISSAKGMTASFSIGSNAGKGELKISGKKFFVALPDAQVWYNGTNLYTYNKNSGETTLTNPTAEELAEVNPLEYVKNASKHYSAAFSLKKIPGKQVLDLTPKNNKGQIKKITLTLRSSDYMPEKLVIEPKSGKSITISINNLKAVNSLNSSEFEYPASKFKNVELIDLR